MYDDARSGDARERDGGGGERDVGGRGASDGERQRSNDPRDVFRRNLDLPRGPDRERVRHRNRTYRLNDEDVRALSTLGAFRVVDADDLREHTRTADPEREVRDSTNHLRESGLVETRNRRRAPIGALTSRLMLLDMVLDDTSRTWLGAHDDKVAYFTGLSRDVELRPADLPHIPFGTGRRRVLRTFPDKLPIGVPKDTYDHVLTYLVTRRQPVDFRAFLVRHFMLWVRLHECTLRIAFPRELHDVMGAYRRAVREELFSPMHPHDSNEFEWYCAERLRREREPSTTPDLRFLEAERRFRSARMGILYRLYRQYGAGFLINIWSPMLQDKLQRGLMKVEFVPLTRQYLHLSPLVGVA